MPSHAWIDPFADRSISCLPNFHAELLKLLSEAKISPDDICLVGGAVVAQAGVRINRDLDFVVHSRSVHLLPEKIPSFLQVDFEGERYSALGDGTLVGDQLFESNWIRVLESGIRVIRPEVEFAYKARTLRDRDLLDLEFLDLVIEKERDWKWEIFNNLYHQPLPKQNVVDELESPTVREKSFWGSLRAGANRRVVSVWRRIRGHFEERWNQSDSPSTANGFYGPEKAPIAAVVDVGLAVSFMRDCNRPLYQRVVSALLLLGPRPESVSEGDWIEEWRLLFFDDLNRDTGALLIRFCEDFSKMRSINFSWFSNMGSNELQKVFPLVASLAVGSDLCVVEGLDRKNSVEDGLPDSHSLSYRDSGFSVAWSEMEWKVLARSGVVWPLILWPTGYDLAEEIEEFFDTHASILRKYEVEWDLEGFLRFVSDLYGGDGTNQWKIDYKVSVFRDLLARSESPRISLFFLSIDEPNFDEKSKRDGFSTLESQAMRVLKSKARQEFSPRIDGYINDVLIHGGDNFGDNRDTLRALERHGFVL
jgi:hypothetical protein